MSNGRALRKKVAAGLAALGLVTAGGKAAAAGDIRDVHEAFEDERTAVEVTLDSLYGTEVVVTGTAGPSWAPTGWAASMPPASSRPSG